MRMKIRTLAVLAIVVLLCGTATADELEEGTKELQFDFSLVDSSAGSNVTIAGSLGWVLTTHHQAGPVISYSRDDPDGGATVDGIALGGFYNYNFSIVSDMMVPYVGGRLEMYAGDLGDLYDSGVAVYGGFRLMTGSRAALNVRLFYEQKAGSGSVEDLDSAGLTAGVSIFF